jgi:hypothetical protein
MSNNLISEFRGPADEYPRLGAMYVGVGYDEHYSLCPQSELFDLRPARGSRDAMRRMILIVNIILNENLNQSQIMTSERTMIMKMLTRKSQILPNILPLLPCLLFE